jgi:carbon-monoxide dehydrogenase small subunit
MLMSTYELLKRVPDPSDEEIREALVGNICRCTGYQFIVESVRLAAQTLRELPSEQRDRCFPA